MQPVQPYDAGYFHIVADFGGGPQYLTATGGMNVTCTPAPAPGRASKWLLGDAGNGLWNVRSAVSGLTTGAPANRKVTNLDGATASPIVETYVSGSDNQKWTFNTDGAVLRIRCWRDTNQRLLAVAGGAPVFGLDQHVEPALAGWTLVPVSAND